MLACHFRSHHARIESTRDKDTHGRINRQSPGHGIGKQPSKAFNPGFVEAGSAAGWIFEQEVAFDDQVAFNSVVVKLAVGQAVFFRIEAEPEEKQLQRAQASVCVATPTPRPLRASAGADATVVGVLVA